MVKGFNESLNQVRKYCSLCEDVLHLCAGMLSMLGTHGSSRSTATVKLHNIPTTTVAGQKQDRSKAAARPQQGPKWPGV